MRANAGRWRIPPVLRLTEAASLGLHAMAMLASDPSRLFTCREMARALSASRDHLVKIMERASAAGLTRAKRGPKGGVRLALPANRISLIRICEAIEGRPMFGSCLLGRPSCPSGRCLLGGLASDVVAYVRKAFTRTTLSVVVKNGWRIPQSAASRGGEK